MRFGENIYFHCGYIFGDVCMLIRLIFKGVKWITDKLREVFVLSVFNKYFKSIAHFTIEILIFLLSH